MDFKFVSVLGYELKIIGLRGTRFSTGVAVASGELFEVSQGERGTALKRHQIQSVGIRADGKTHWVEWAAIWSVSDPVGRGYPDHAKGLFVVTEMFDGSGSDGWSKAKG